METCANCGTQIGKLEQPHLWNNEIVCKLCHSRLSASSPPMAERLDYQSTRAASSQTIAAINRMNQTGSVKATTDAVAGRVIVIALLIIFILGCLGVILAKLSS